MVTTGGIANPVLEAASLGYSAKVLSLVIVKLVLGTHNLMRLIIISNFFKHSCFVQLTLISEDISAGLIILQGFVLLQVPSFMFRNISSIALQCSNANHLTLPM